MLVLGPKFVPYVLVLGFLSVRDEPHLPEGPTKHLVANEINKALWVN